MEVYWHGMIDPMLHLTFARRSSDKKIKHLHPTKSICQDLDNILHGLTRYLGKILSCLNLGKSLDMDLAKIMS